MGKLYDLTLEERLGRKQRPCEHGSSGYERGHRISHVLIGRLVQRAA